MTPLLSTMYRSFKLPRILLSWCFCPPQGSFHSHRAIGGLAGATLVAPLRGAVEFCLRAWDGSLVPMAEDEVRANYRLIARHHTQFIVADNQVEAGQSYKMWINIRLKESRQFDWGGGGWWYILAIVTAAFSILSTCLVYIILGFDVLLMPYHEKLDKYQGNRISLLTRLYFAFCSLLQRGCPRAALCSQKPTSVARNEMMGVATVQTYPYLSLMTWLIFLQHAQIRDCLLSFSSVETANAYSLGLPQKGKRLTCRRTTEMNTDEIWKCNFPSVNHLSKGPANHQSGDPWRGRPHL